MKLTLALLLLCSLCAAQSSFAQPRFSADHDLFVVVATLTASAGALDAVTTSVCDNESTSPELFSSHPNQHRARVILVESSLIGGSIFTSWLLKRAKLPRVIWLSPMIYMSTVAVRGGTSNFTDPHIKGRSSCL